MSFFRAGVFLRGFRFFSGLLFEGFVYPLDGAVDCDFGVLRGFVREFPLGLEFFLQRAI